MPENPQPYNANVLNTIRRDAARIKEIARHVGVHELAIAAPIAREMNKAEVGDYGNRPGIDIAKDLIVNYQGDWTPSGDLVFVPMTHELMANNYRGVNENRISNLGHWGWLQRALNPVLNDLGPGKIQIGTAISLLNDYAQSHPNEDPLDLRQYLGHYDKLVRDMQDPATEYDLAYRLYALNAKKAEEFFIHKLDEGEAGLARWDTYKPHQKAALIAAYGAMGEDQLDAKAKQQPLGMWAPDLEQTDGASYTLKNGNAEALNQALGLQSDLAIPDARRADLAPEAGPQAFPISPADGWMIGSQPSGTFANAFPSLSSSPVSQASVSPAGGVLGSWPGAQSDDGGATPSMLQPRAPSQAGSASPLFGPTLPPDLQRLAALFFPLGSGTGPEKSLAAASAAAPETLDMHNASVPPVSSAFGGALAPGTGFGLLPAAGQPQIGPAADRGGFTSGGSALTRGGPDRRQAQSPMDIPLPPDLQRLAAFFFP